MKKLTRILSIAVAVLMLVAATSVFASAEEGKSYTYTLDFNNLLNENDYFEVFKSTWNNDYSAIAAERVDFNAVASGSGPVSGKIGLGIGFGTSECRVYKCVTDKKNYFENDGSGYTTVFKFTAPVSGTYTTTFHIPVVTGALTNTNIFYFIGSDAEGFTMNTVGGTTQGRHDFNDPGRADGIYKMTFELEKGQSIAACILAWSKIYYQVEEISVTLTNAAEEPPVITEPPVETDPPINTEPDNDGDTTVTTEEPDSEKSESSGLVKLLGGSIVSAVCAIAAVVVVVGVVVAVIVVKSKKK